MKNFSLKIGWIREVAGQRVIGTRFAIYVGLGNWLKGRAYGFVFDRYTKEQVERVRAEYGDNWLSHYLDTREAPVRYVTLYWGKHAKTIDLSRKAVLSAI